MYRWGKCGYTGVRTLNPQFHIGPGEWWQNGVHKFTFGIFDLSPPRLPWVTVSCFHPQNNQHCVARFPHQTYGLFSILGYWTINTHYLSITMTRIMQLLWRWEINLYLCYVALCNSVNKEFLRWMESVYFTNRTD